MQPAWVFVVHVIVMQADAGTVAPPTPAAPPAAAPAAPTPPAGEVALQRALTLLHDEDNTVENLEKSIASFDAACNSDLPAPRRAYAYAHKALAYLRLGDFQKTKDKRLELYKLGQKSAEAGIKLDAKCADAHFYRGATLGRWGQQRGIMQSLFLVKDVTGSFKTALKVDPNHAESKLALGLADSMIPSFAGGSKSRAERAFRQVLQHDPHFTRAMLDLAELLADDDRDTEAVQWAEKVLAEKSPSRPGEWRKFDRARAEKLLQKLKK